MIIANINNIIIAIIGRASFNQFKWGPIKLKTETPKMNMCKPSAANTPYSRNEFLNSRYCLFYLWVKEKLGGRMVKKIIFQKELSSVDTVTSRLRKWHFSFSQEFG